MSGLYYIGKTPAVDGDPSTQADARATFSTGVTRRYVADQIDAGVADKVTKVQVDAWDSDYAPVTYYKQRDTLLVPKTAKGAVGGVATLSSTTQTTLAGGSGYVATQVPVLGAGILRGPYGATKQHTRANVGATPQIIAEWLYPTSNATSFGAMPLTGTLWPFCTVAAQNTGGRSVIEVRAGTTNTYSDQTLIGIGYGRTWFDGYQLITVMPAGPINTGQGVTPPRFEATTTLNVTMWLLNDSGGTSNITAGLVYSSALYVARTAQ